MATTVNTPGGLEEAKATAKGRKHGFVQASGLEDVRIPRIQGDLSPQIVQRRLREHQCLYWEPRVKSSNLLVILFGTVARRIGFSFEHFLVAMKRLGAEVFIIEDRQATLLVTGVEAWGPSRRRAVSVINSVIDHRKPRSVCTIGHSSGATAAVIYATLLQTRKAMAFSPMVDLASLIGGKGYRNRKRIWKSIVASSFHDEERIASLRTYIEESDYPDAIEVHYALNSPLDVIQVAYLKNSPKVTLRGWEHDNHDVTRFLAQKGNLTDLLVEGLKLEGQTLNEI